MHGDRYSAEQPQPDDVPLVLFQMISRALARGIEEHEKECHEPPVGSQLWRELRAN